MASPAIVSLPKQPDYGAVELKEWIRKHTYKGFIYTVAIFVLFFILYFVTAKIQEIDAEGPPMAPISKMTLENLPPPPQSAEEAAPPPQTTQIVNTGPAVRAGTPVPVPDALIEPDLQDFATVDVQQRASAEGGTGEDLGGFASNIDFELEEKIDVKVREEEPAPDEFIPVEVQPQFDYSKLQKDIEYPEMAKRAGIEGRVIVRVLITKEGKPKKTIIEYSDSDMLNKAAVQAIMKQVFTPAIQNGQPVAVWVSIPINFKLD